MTKTLLLLADGFEILEASAFIDVMGWNFLEGDQSTQLYSCALRKEIKSSFNQKFIVDFEIDEIDIDSFDALAIPGGFEEYGFYKDAYHNDFLDLINRFREKNKIIATICVGALPLGKSGALKGKNGTTYNNKIRRSSLEGFGVNVVDKSIVFDDNMITSRGPSTAIEVAFMLLEKLTDHDNLVKVKTLMGY